MVMERSFFEKTQVMTCGKHTFPQARSNRCWM